MFASLSSDFITYALLTGAVAVGLFVFAYLVLEALDAYHDRKTAADRALILANLRRDVQPLS